MGDTVLIRALDSYVREQNLQWVLSHHPNIEVTDPDGNTPLCLLSQGDSELGDNELKMQLLLDHGANTETQCRHNATALIMASMKGRVEAVALLLDHGANINAVDNDGYTSLMHACSSDAPESLALAKVLLDHGADLEIRAKDGSSAMDLTLYPWSATHRTLSAMLTDAKNGRRSALLERKSRLEQTLSTGRCDRAQSSPSDRTTCFQGIATLYYSSPSDELWNTAMGIGLALKPIPTEVPQESRKYFVQANDVFKNSQGDADAKKAIVLYRQALVQAPWFAEAWNNLSLAQEKVADYKGAASSLKNFMLVRPEAANDQVRLDHIYLLEGKAK